MPTDSDMEQPWGGLFSFREHLCGSKEPGRFWEGVVLGEAGVRAFHRGPGGGGSWVLWML